MDILIVEDDRITAMIIAKMIEMELPEVVCEHKTNGLEALNFLNTQVQNGSLPRTIILDINMPVMDGWKLLEHMKENEILSTISVFILTSSISRIDQIKSTNYNQVKGFISKPLDREKLKMMSKELIKK